MRRVCLASLVACFAALSPLPASAGWNEFWDRVHVDWHRNNCWPVPFVEADRNAARAPFGVMVQRGWERQTTLGDHHFDPQTQLLTPEGETKLRWILSQTPEQYRAVFVSRGLNGEITRVRLDSVQQATTRLITAGPLPPVQESGEQYVGWPADRIDITNQKFLNGLPNPTLPPMKEAGGS